MAVNVFFYKNKDGSFFLRSRFNETLIVVEDLIWCHVWQILWRSLKIWFFHIEENFTLKSSSWSSSWVWRCVSHRTRFHSEIPRCSRLPLKHRKPHQISAAETFGPRPFFSSVVTIDLLLRPSLSTNCSSLCLRPPFALRSHLSSFHFFSFLSIPLTSDLHLSWCWGFAAVKLSRINLNLD